MKKNINLLLALLLADALFDAIVFNAILNGKPTNEEETDKHPLIGRRYKVGDNSYIKDIESGVDSGVGLYDREVIIVSDPYVEEIPSYFSDEPKKRLFVNVFSTDSARKYRVLFDESWLIDEDK